MVIKWAKSKVSANTHTQKYIDYLKNYWQVLRCVKSLYPCKNLVFFSHNRPISLRKTDQYPQFHTKFSQFHFPLIPSDLSKAIPTTFRKGLTVYKFYWKVELIQIRGNYFVRIGPVHFTRDLILWKCWPFFEGCTGWCGPIMHISDVSKHIVKDKYRTKSCNPFDLHAVLQPNAFQTNICSHSVITTSHIVFVPTLGVKRKV